MTNLKFTKMQATGNDFVVVSNTNHKLQTTNYKLPGLAKKLCDRRFGIGADGLLVLEKSKKSDFKMRIFNPDGSEAEMCGNGLRCAAVFAYKNKIASSDMSVETKAGILNAQVKKSLVKIKMTEPASVKLGLEVNADGQNYEVHYINTGVPHIVNYTDELESIDVPDLGSQLRYHGLFRPKGANVNFVKTKSKNSIQIRTYERGVEAETLACGTGAVASAIISNMIMGTKSPVKVLTKGGLLKIYFKKNDNKFNGVFLEGEASVVFEGSISLA